MVGLIKQDKALEIIQDVLAAVEQWNVFANNAGVSALQRQMIWKEFCQLQKTLLLNSSSK